MQNENVAKIFDSGDAQNRPAESIAPLRNQRSFRPSPSPLTSHTGFPSPLEGARSASPVKAGSEISSVSPLGSVPLHKGDTPFKTHSAANFVRLRCRRSISS